MFKSAIYAAVVCGGALLWLTAAPQALAKTISGQVPDEYETLGGHSLGFANSATAAAADLGAVRSNPAMLAVEKQYTISAGYHWPTYGRDFYQAGAVDSKTAGFAAGVVYTGVREKYQLFEAQNAYSEQLDRAFDSPVKYRVAFGLAQAFSQAALGLGGQYVEGFVAGSDAAAASPQLRLRKGVTLALGAAGLLTRELRFGIAAENLGNKNVKTLAPQTLRAGLAYTLGDGNITAHADLQQRERVPQERAYNDLPVDILSSAAPQLLEAGSNGPERMGVLSASVRMQDVLRLLAGYGKEFGGSGRQQLAGGLALVSQNYTLSYLVNQPYLQTSKRLHQAVNVSVQVAF